MASAKIQIIPTLLVGVGGTGCSIAKMVKRIVYEQVHPDDRRKVAMRFVGIDTDLVAKQGGDGMETLDAFIELAGKAELSDSDEGEAAQLIRSWMPKTRMGKPAIDPSHLAAGQGAGGKRLLGRFAYHYFAPFQFQVLKNEIKELVALTDNPLEEWSGVEFERLPQIEIFVIGSFAGGTGSGTFLDAVATCHMLCDQSAPGFRRAIHGVFVLPQAFENVAHVTNRPINRATAYACLKDLELLLNTSDPEMRRFAYHTEGEYTVEGPFLDNVYLIDSHGKFGSMDNVELFRMIATNLYGMIGTPMGRSHRSTENNAGMIGQPDPAGGKRHFSTFGLCGIDYDLESMHARFSAIVGTRLVDSLLGAPTVTTEWTNAQAQNALQAFKDGLASQAIQDLIGDMAGESRFTEDLTPWKPKRLGAQLRDLKQAFSGAKFRARLVSDAAYHLGQEGGPRAVGKTSESRHYRRGIALAIDQAVWEHGARPALGIVRRMREIVDDLVAAINQGEAPSGEGGRSAVDDEIDALLNIGGLQALLNPSSVNETKEAAVEAFNAYVNRELQREAAKALRDQALLGEKGVSRQLADAQTSLERCVHALEEARTVLDNRSRETRSDRNVMELSKLIFDAVPVSDLEALCPKSEHLGGVLREAFANLAGPSEELDAASQGARVRAVCTRFARLAVPGKALADEATRLAGDQLHDETHHHLYDILAQAHKTADYRIENVKWPEVFSTALAKVVPQLSPMMLLRTTPDNLLYDYAIALCPVDTDGSPHPAQTDFLVAFKGTVNQVLGNASANAELTPGKPNRLLLGLWAQAFALNDRTLPVLKELRGYYKTQLPLSPFIEADSRWQGYAGPGADSRHSRETVFALGVAYGLIAVKATRYYVNLVSAQVEDAVGKRPADAYEIDLEKLIATVAGGGNPLSWFGALCIGPTDQKVGSTKIPPAYTFAGGEQPEYRKAARLARDLLGVGRSVAMKAFVGDQHEDCQDIEDGISYFLESYVQARGKAAVLQELEGYLHALENAEPADEDMRAQVTLEVSCLQKAIETLRKTGRLGLREGV